MEKSSVIDTPLEEHRNIMVAIYINLFLFGMGLMAEFKFKTLWIEIPFHHQKIRPYIWTWTWTSCCGTDYDNTIPIAGFCCIRTLITMEAVIKLFEEILQWLRRSPRIQENGSASMEANDFSRKIELPVKIDFRVLLTTRF